MTTIPRNKLKASRVVFHGEKSGGANARLAALMNVSEKTVKGWLAAPNAPDHRDMSATARRLLSVLLYLHATGVLTPEELAKIQLIEGHLMAGTGKLDRFLGTLFPDYAKRKRPDDQDDD